MTWQPPVEVAAGGAYQGPWRMNASDFRYVDDPTVAVAGDGTVFVVWADQGAQDLFLQRYGPDGEAQFAEPVNVSRSGDTFSWLPRLVTADDGREVHVLWQEIVFSGGSHGGEAFFARSIDGGETFTEPMNLSRTPAGVGKGRLSARYWHNGSLDLVRGPDGELYAAWTEYEGPLRFSRSKDGGETFSEPLQVAGGEGRAPARGPTLAVGGDGTIYLAWTVGEDPAADIQLARSLDRGRSFSEPAAVAPGDGHADAPRLAVTGDARVHLVYAESAAGPLRNYHIRYARAPVDSMAFDSSRVVAEAEAEEGLRSVGFPALAVDGADRLYLLWERYPTSSARPLGLGYAVSSDGGETFSAPAVLPGSDDPALGFNGSLQGLLTSKLAVNPAGEVAVVNSRYASGEASRVRLHRGRKE